MVNKLIGYIGTYTDGDSEGIYKFSVDKISGKVSDISLAGKIDNPTYLTLNSTNNKVYSVAKSTGELGETLGGIASLDIESDYSLSLTNVITEPGKPPCHVLLTSDNKYVIASNYHDKHATVYSLDSKLNVNSIVSKAIHNGPAHIHYAMATPDNKFICILDLGRDEICLYSFIDGSLVLNDSLTVKTKANSGPRHMVFSSCGNFAFVLCELSSEVITLKYNDEKGFEVISYVSTLPTNFTGKNATAAIRITKDGKYLYASNRGHDSIVAYKIINNTLELIDIYPTYGIEPRDFNLTPDNNFLIIGNHRSNSITVYKKLENGTLELIERDNYAPSPVCIVFMN